jgi:hypothetical protein
MGKMNVTQAGKRMMNYATKHGCQCGVIGVNKHAEILCVNNTKAMSWCYIKDGKLSAFQVND